MPGDRCTHASEDAPPGLAQRAVLATIRGYQLLFAPMYAGSCRFVPSCSAYAAEAVRRFGAARGSWLAVRRLLRCRPLGAHGFDPVPAAAPHGRTPASSSATVNHDL